MNKENKKCNCSPNCECGCQNGEECTCNHEHCNCGCHEHEHCDCGCHEHEHNCGCLDGKECTCGDHCNCESHEHEHCDCGCENSDFSQYELAFRQLEDALIKVDKELEATKKQAADNERLAIAFKKDLERYKERAKEQEENMKTSAVTNIADKLIPILDNFEQALKVTGDPNVLKGFSMVENMLKNAITSLGIEEIETEDQEFDPNLHNAVGKQRTDKKKLHNKIATVYQKGYKMSGENGKVIRHSMVEIYLND